MWNEQKELAGKEQQNTLKEKKKEPVTPDALLQKLGLEAASPIPKTSPPKKESFSFSAVFSWLQEKLQKEKPAIPTLLPPRLPEEFNRVTPKSNVNTTTGTASLRLDRGLSATPRPDTLEAESDWAFKYEELQKERDTLKEKFERLDSLFKEKGDAFDKSEKALANEVKNRKEFNKVKDLLEKELKDNKDKYRELEVKLTSSETESGAYLKRVNQLEEKIKTLEKTILVKEGETKEAQGQIQGRQKLIAELEEKIKAQEKLIQEKNEKINEIVSHLKAGEKKEEGKEDATPTKSSLAAVDTAVEPAADPPAPIPQKNEPAATEENPAAVEKPKEKEGNIILQAIEKDASKPAGGAPAPDPVAKADPTAKLENTENLPKTEDSPAATPIERPVKNSSSQKIPDPSEAPLKFTPDILEKDEKPDQPDKISPGSENDKNQNAPEAKTDST